MFTTETRIHVDALKARDVFDFLIDCSDDRYQRWWPGTHLRFHTIHRRPGNVGNLVYMDEFVGTRRVRMQGVVIEALPGSRIVWQLKPIFRLAVPVWLALDLRDDATGVFITHSDRAGYTGAGAVLDLLFRMYLNARFIRQLDAHVREEFPRLRDMLCDHRAITSGNGVSGSQQRPTREDGDGGAGDAP